MFVDKGYSLTDLLGNDYIQSVLRANAFFEQGDPDELREIANKKITFFPEAIEKKSDELLKFIGTKVIEAAENENDGAPTNAYRNAFTKAAAPISGFSFYRIGESGKLYFVGKSEHYHAAVGHRFPGFTLIDNARKIGVLNATHNNTRGFITRTMERELIRIANDIPAGDDHALNSILNSKEKHVLNRVINLETGSLAVEAAMKMVLHRFYKLGTPEEPCKYEGRIPVFFVMADVNGGCEANYHGTTMIAQTLRNIWPDLYHTAERNNIYKVVSVKINDINDLENKIIEYNKPPYKTAAFMHEIVLMNYGGVLLDKTYLQKAYELCRESDTLTLVDEIQSCVWYKEVFLYKKYSLQPDFVIIGKGLGGGEYAASKVIATSEVDNLNQFGALVTNGQEELASLAYLITMRFIQDNGQIIEDNQKYFFDGLLSLAGKYSEKISKIEGLGYLAAIVFDNLDGAKEFAKKVNERCIDVSAQTYKKNCPAGVLMKLPLITTRKAAEYILNVFDEILRSQE